MQITMEIVKQLRFLLNNLEGNPVGFKLNSQLNLFLLQCFKYHVDLWATFLCKFKYLIYDEKIPIKLFFRHSYNITSHKLFIYPAWYLRNIGFILSNSNAFRFASSDDSSCVLFLYLCSHVSIKNSF